MVSEKFPDITKPLLEQTQGVKADLFSKKVVFDPHYIINIKYTAGCHYVQSVIGKTIYGTEELRLLHFKNLELNYLINRHHELYKRRSERAKQLNMSFHYGFSDQQITDEFNQMLKKAKPIE